MKIEFVGKSNVGQCLRISASCLMLLLAMIVVLCASTAPAMAARQYTATISPNTDTAGHMASAYTITLTNTSTAGETLGSSTIAVPAGYSAVALGSTSASGGKSWSASLVSGNIKFRGTGGTDRLSIGQSASVSFTATSPATGGTYTWTTATTTNVGDGGQSLAILGFQPSVIIATNNLPVAANDFIATDEDTPLTVNAPGVLGNDTDADANTLTAVLLTQPAAGQVTLNANGSLTYTPNADFNGNDSFTYAANDGISNSAAATVYITIAPVADNPVAQGDAFTTDEDRALNVDAPGVLGNDTDVDHDALSAVLGDDVQNGTLVLNGDGSFQYTPDSDFNGTDSFSYHANDGSADSNVVTVSITVNAVNDAPSAHETAIGIGTYATNEDTALNVAAPGLLSNFIDAEGDALTAVLDNNVSDGTLTLNSDGSFDYTPDSNFNGTDSFTYHANDGFADSAIVTVTITINAVNDAPVATGDSYTTGEDTTLTATTGVLDNDSDLVEGDILDAVLDTDVSHGTLSLNKDGTFEYTPGSNFTGTDSFTYHANDGSDDSNIVTVNITVNAVNDAPVAANDNSSTIQDTALTVSAPGVLGNDTDVEGDALTAVIDTDVSHGTLALNSDGSYNYIPSAGFYGTDSFTYHANDGFAGGNTATVTITVTQTFTISGLIRVGNVTPLVGINVTRTGGVTVQTDANGRYVFTGLLPGGYLITPGSASYTFSPVAASLSVTTANRAANFIASPVVPSYNVIGRVATSSGVAIAGVTVTRSGSAGVGSPTSVITNSAGYYTFPKVANGTYTITPSLTGYQFVPATRSVTVNSADVTGQNFTSGWSISGRITTSSGAAVEGASVSSGAGAPVLTSAQGYYTLWGLQPGTYTVAPSKDGMTFTPATKTVTLGTSNVANQNFIGMSP